MLMTDELKCPFSSTLIGDQFGCQYADQVVRRGGAEINCTALTAHSHCKALFEQLKQAALPAFGVEDDLLTMPHSVLVKVQFGGLLGLQRKISIDSVKTERIEDISALVAASLERFESTGAIPCQEFIDDMVNYKIQRKKRRGS